MSFKSPIWNNKKNCYEININIDTKFQYTELRNNFLEKEPESSEFYNRVNTIIEELGEEGKGWFSSPIKPSVVLKRLVNKYNYCIPAPYEEDNTRYKLIYTPTLFIIYPGKFELYWEVNYIKDDIIPSEFIEFSEELEEAPAKTIIINDIIANVEIPFDNEEIVEGVSSRAAFKQKVRLSRLKAAIASMKAEKMAEKYYRRYGIQTGVEFDSESELSLESNENDSELE